MTSGVVPPGLDDKPPFSLWRTFANLSSLLPSRADYAAVRRTWRGDVLAGITVGVVALPLALAFGVASGMGAAAGLVTAVVAGFLAAVFGGSNFQVSGPTGAMTVVLVPIVASAGQGAAVAVAAIAGVLLIIMAIVGLGQLVSLIPWPVIEGFTVGIALIIALQQVPNAIGVGGSTSTNTVINAAQSLRSIGPSAMPAIFIATCTILLIVLLTRIRKTIPAALISISLITLVSFFVGADVPVVGSIPSHLPTPTVPDLSPSAIQPLFGSALAVAVLAAIESLLSAKVSDGMADAKPTQSGRELVGQGVANIGASFFGGMPATGAIARTAVNVRAGAGTRLAAIVHSLTLLFVMLVAARFVGEIPLAALGGVLLVTAFRMIEPRTVRSILSSGKGDCLVFVLTATATLVFDLIVAVEIGVVLAGVLALVALSRSSGATQEPLPDLSDNFDQQAEHDLLREHIAVYRIDGAMFFGITQRFLEQLTAVSNVQVVILRMSGVDILDASGAHALGEVVKDLQAHHVTVIFKGLQPRHEQLLKTHGALTSEGEHRHSYQTLDAAIKHAQSHIAAHCLE